MEVKEIIKIIRAKKEAIRREDYEFGTITCNDQFAKLLVLTELELEIREKLCK